MASYFDSVSFNPLTDNRLGGVGVKAFFANISEIVECPALPSSPATAAEFSEISDDFTMVTDKYFESIQLVPDYAKYESEAVGPKGTKFFKHTVPVKVLGDGPSQKKFLRLVLNASCVVLLPTADCDGKHYILGNCCHPASVLEAKSNTGTTPEDEDSGNSITLVSYAYGQVPKPIFTGTIPTTP